MIKMDLIVTVQGFHLESFFYEKKRGYQVPYLLLVRYLDEGRVILMGRVQQVMSLTWQKSESLKNSNTKDQNRQIGSLLTFLISLSSSVSYIYFFSIPFFNLSKTVKNQIDFVFCDRERCQDLCDKRDQSFILSLEFASKHVVHIQQQLLTFFFRSLLGFLYEIPTRFQT